MKIAGMDMAVVSAGGKVIGTADQITVEYKDENFHSTPIPVFSLGTVRMRTDNKLSPTLSKTIKSVKLNDVTYW